MKNQWTLPAIVNSLTNSCNVCFVQKTCADLSVEIATGKVPDLDGIFRRASVFATSEMSHDLDGHKPGRSTETKPL